VSLVSGVPLVGFPNAPTLVTDYPSHRIHSVIKRLTIGAKISVRVVGIFIYIYDKKFALGSDPAVVSIDVNGLSVLNGVWFHIKDNESRIVRPL